MKRIFLLASLTVVLGVSAFGQEMNSKGEPVAKNEQNAAVDLKSGEKITRGAALAKGVKKTSVEKAFAKPDDVAG